MKQASVPFHVFGARFRGAARADYLKVQIPIIY